MVATRRAVSFGLLAAGAVLAGCGGGPGPAAAGAAGPEPAMQAVPNAGLRRLGRWLPAARAAQGIAPATFDSAFRDAGFLPGVIERDRNQTEFTRTLEDYLAIAASEERVARAAPRCAQHGATLAADRGALRRRAAGGHAVWGMESFYGKRRGNVPVISALATLAYEGRRGAFFESQLVAALRSCRTATSPPDGMTGSWAGAMGHTQFIPTSLSRLRRRFPRRRAARHLVGGSDRRARLDRRLSLALGLEARTALGGRGAAAGRVLPGRPGAARRAAPRTGPRWACATWTGGRCRTTARRRSSRRWGGWPGLHGLPQLHGDHPLQQRRELRDRDRAPVRPPGGDRRSAVPSRRTRAA